MAEPLPIQTVPGQEYGAAGQQEEAQQTIPLAPPPGTAGAPSGQAPAGPLPGMLGQFDGPSQFANEPITAGLDAGEGPGSEALAFTSGNRSRHLLERAVAETEDPLLMRILQALDDGGR